MIEFGGAWICGVFFPLTPPNDSLAPARSALAGLRLRPDSFRRFPSGSSPPGRGRNFVTFPESLTLGDLIQRSYFARREISFRRWENRSDR